MILHKLRIYYGHTYIYSYIGTNIAYSYRPRIEGVGAEEIQRLAIKI